MVVDVGVVKNYIKPKADSTLYNMKKVDLIEYIRTLEHNYNVAVSFNENQAKYIESLDAVEVVRCKDCKHWLNSWVAPGAEHAHGYCHIEETDDVVVGRWDDDFCSYGERKDNERKAD